MKQTGKSFGMVMTALLTVGWLGLGGAGSHDVLNAQVPARPAKLRGVASSEPGKPASSSTRGAPGADGTDWKFVAQQLENRLAALEQKATMPQQVARDASSSVALVIGEYIWTDRSGRRPLRYQGFDASGAPLRDANGQEIVAFDGQGPVVVRDFTGTGFLLNSGKVLTSGFVLNPWFADPLLDESDEPERIPSIRLLHAFFPGHTAAVDLKIDHAEENAETVLCSIEGESVIAPGLQLSKTSVETGEPMVSIGYPGGVLMLASRISDDAKRELFKFGSNNSDELAGWLASRGFIQPVVTLANVSALTDGKIFYDMPNAAGSAGSPLVSAEGRVVGMSEATNPDYPSVNRALPVSSFKPWLDGLTLVIQ